MPQVLCKHEDKRLSGRVKQVNTFILRFQSIALALEIWRWRFAAGDLALEIGAGSWGLQLCVKCFEEHPTEIQYIPLV